MKGHGGLKETEKGRWWGKENEKKKTNDQLTTNMSNIGGTELAKMKDKCMVFRREDS